MNLRMELHRLCRNHIVARIADIQQNIAQMQEAIANETKSSAGDKYETTREMLQQEADLNNANLHELIKIREVLDNISVTAVSDHIVRGSVVHTNKGNFYIAAGAGSFIFQGRKYYSISEASPIGKKMKGLRKRDQFNFNDQQFSITDIF